jgi:hypothetical protein
MFKERYPGHEPWRYSDLATADPSRFDLAIMDEKGKVAIPPVRTVASSPLAPPPPDPEPKKVKVFQVQNAIRSPRVGFKGACGRNSKARKKDTPPATQKRDKRVNHHAPSNGKRRFPLPVDICQHAKWARNGQPGAQQKLRCAGCGTCRRLSIEIAEKLLRGEIPVPAKHVRWGVSLKPDQHGTWRTMRKYNCKCELCLGMKRASANAWYARNVRAANLGKAA